MIGSIPRSLKVGEDKLSIRADYRIALTILQAWADVELNDVDKYIITLALLYENPVPREHMEEAYKQALWFLDGGIIDDDAPKIKRPKLYDWEQDESILFSAINKVAGKEVRECDYLHWWTFLGYFNEIGEGTFSNVVNIRNKRARGKKLEKWEQEFYSHNKKMIELKRVVTADEQKEIDEVNALLGL